MRSSATAFEAERTQRVRRLAERDSIGISWVQQTADDHARLWRQFDQTSVCFSKGWCAAEIFCVGFYQYRIEVVLPDQDAKPVSQLWLAVIRAVLVRRLYRLSLFHRGTGGTVEPTQLLDFERLQTQIV
jgi:hypothetical protein